MTERLTCPAGHSWHAPLREARLGDCRLSGSLIIVEGHDNCPECGLACSGGPAYCWTCGEEITPARASEIAAASDAPDQLLPRDFLCAAHAQDVAGKEVLPRESVIEWFDMAGVA